jgi:hypothetical protein
MLGGDSFQVSVQEGFCLTLEIGKYDAVAELRSAGRTNASVPTCAW